MKSLPKIFHKIPQQWNFSPQLNCSLRSKIFFLKKIKSKCQTRINERRSIYDAGLCIWHLLNRICLCVVETESILVQMGIFWGTFINDVQYLWGLCTFFYFILFALKYCVTVECYFYGHHLWMTPYDSGIFIDLGLIK